MQNTGFADLGELIRQKTEVRGQRSEIRGWNFGVRRLVGAFASCDLSQPRGAESETLLRRQAAARKSGDQSPHSKVSDL